MRADIGIYGQGFYQIRGETRRGLQFMVDVQGNDQGVAYSDDTRMTQDIADAAVRDGLCVAVNGKQVHTRELTHSGK